MIPKQENQHLQGLASPYKACKVGTDQILFNSLHFYFTINNLSFIPKSRPFVL
ncbi:hypothetical protein GCM10009865_49350 [Aeromicrobium ponti]